MKRKIKWRLVVGSLALMVVLYLYQNREPAYYGYTLREWFEEYRKQPGSELAVRAFREHADRGVPILIEKLREEESWRHKLLTRAWNALPAPFQKRIPSPLPYTKPMKSAVLLLGLMGPAARGAEPELLALEKALEQKYKLSGPGIKKAGSSIYSGDFIEAWQSIDTVLIALLKIDRDGPEPIAALLSVSTLLKPASVQSYRAEAGRSLLTRCLDTLKDPHRLPAIRAAYPALKTHLYNTNGEANRVALFGLIQLTPSFPEATADVIQATALSPSLTNRISLQMEAYNPLKFPQDWKQAIYMKMSQRTNWIVPALIMALKRPEAAARAHAAHLLAEFGPEALPAIPALQEALEDSAPEVRSYAASTLQRLR